VGIGKTPSGWETADYVLGKFTEQEKPEIENAISRAVKATEAWMTGGTQLAMNQFNADPNKKPKSKKSKLDRQPREQQTKPRLSDSDSTVQLDQNDEN
jgi:PTH1 family peptidyl-tRNA hydrolase